MSRMYQWYLIRKPTDINLIDLINRTGYGPCEYKDNKILLHVQWAKEKIVDSWEPAFAPSRKGYEQTIVDCSCNYILLHHETAMLIVEPYLDGTLVIKQFDREKKELPNGTSI